MTTKRLLSVGAAIIATAAVAGCGGSSSSSSTTSTTPLTAQDHTDFVGGCTQAGQSSAGCECIYQQLTGPQGLNTGAKIAALLKQVQAASTDPTKIPANYRAAVLACKSQLSGGGSGGSGSTDTSGSGSTDTSGSGSTDTSGSTGSTDTSGGTTT